MRCLNVLLLATSHEWTCHSVQSPNLPQKQFAMGVKSYGGKLELMEFHPAPLKDDEVLIAVQYCGMCHR